MATGDAALAGRFAALDWAVMLGYLGLVTVLGVCLAGKQKSLDDFFRGGGRLPWFAVSASLIATTVSAVTFVGVPAVSFNPAGGNMTYLQLGLVAGLLSRLFIVWILIPAYYRHRVYSPYDYLHEKLGAGARGVTTALFTLGGVLAQSARVYLTALVLELVLHDQLAALQGVTGLSPFAGAVVLIGVIAVVWTMLGGIATVVWTDALLFLVFVTGGLAALGVVVFGLDGGVGELWRVGRERGKLEVFNFQSAFDLTENYTLAAAGFAAVVGQIGAYGTDQLLAQRIFCCKNARHAKFAVMGSYAGEAITLLMLLVGVGLFVYYTAHPGLLSDAGAAKVAQENDKIFPVFILTQMPAGLTGLVVAGIFAAAISSLTSILAALAQTTLSATVLPWRAKRRAQEPAAGEDDRQTLLLSRLLIVFWGVVLCAAAFGVSAYKSHAGVAILDLALGLATYIWGGLFAAFLLAWLPLNINGRGLVWSAPLGVLAVVATKFHEPWAVSLLSAAGVFLVASWMVAAFASSATARRGARLAKTPLLIAGCGLVVLMGWRGYFVQTDPETGEPLMIYPDAVDPETGDRLLDPDAPPVFLTHPITGQALADADGTPLLAPPEKQPALKNLSLIHI